MTKSTEIVLVTGVTGFVGKAVGLGLLSQGRRGVGCVRQLPSLKPSEAGLRLVDYIPVGNTDEKTDWRDF